MRLKALLLLPLISIIGISVVIKIFGSFIFAVILNKLKKDNQLANMWKCRKCAKPVYFAERKSSLGFDWHPQCLKCEECGKTLTVGQHAEHKGIPYCHIPCYGALFGPTLYGHGSRVESHTSFGKSKLNSDQMVDKLLEGKLKEYNQYYEGKSNAIQYRERNGKYILEGSIRIYWDVSNVIQLKEDNDDRVFVRRRISYVPLNSSAKHLNVDDEQSTTSSNLELASNQSSFSSDDLSSPDDFNRSYKTLPIRRSFASDHPLHDNTKYTRKSFDDEYVQQFTDSKTNTESLPNATPDSGSVTFRRTNLRRSRVQLKRRCSINGHFYNRETSNFTPAHGSVTSVWISSLVNVPEVINMLLDKFKVKNQPNSFALFVVRDNGEVKRLQDYDCPLLVRVMLGPNEDAAKVFILNKDRNEISTEVAQYLNLSYAELHMFLRKFDEEEFREINRIKKRYTDIKKCINKKLNQSNVNN